MARKSHLRGVAPGEVAEPPKEPLSLLDAVASGDRLEILKAQRQIIAEGLMKAGDNTRPQYSNELTKLSNAIAEEESRRSAESDEASVVAELEVEQWDGTGY
ncbi:hypothetical protein Y710_18250 [Gordonia sp. QH-12]|uniref:hypothetical protein n=1 Tax=Gordonia sp. QH-12 TaxID=1437876 RepID=UPI00078182A9|nr:hypothetical protein [Gordonia sp. QH-12]KXT55654.1 hypothetical protein Y710_18250 [Gordonia sp. QH-12]